MRCNKNLISEVVMTNILHGVRFVPQTHCKMGYLTSCKPFPYVRYLDKNDHPILLIVETFKEDLCQ